MTKEEKNASADRRRPRRPIEFTIDGRSFTVKDRKQTASALLELAGLSANGYDLGRLRANNPRPKRFEDDQVIRVRRGARYVSIRECAAVA